MNKLDPKLLESCRRDVIKYLLDKRTLHKFRLLGKYFCVAIDGSGVYSFDKEPYAGCPSKTDHIFEYSKAALTHQGHQFYYMWKQLWATIFLVPLELFPPCEKSKLNYRY